MSKVKLRDIVTLDFETFYSKEYSLTAKKYNTSSYIRDPLFKAHCVGIKDGIKKTVWYPHEDIPLALKKHGVGGRPLMAHNTQFDAFILSHHYGVIPPYYLDTLGMARALHGTLGRNDLDTVSKLYGRGGKIKPVALKNVKGMRDLPDELLEALAEYMCGDCDECFAIGKIQLGVFPEDELDLVDWTVRAFCDPVLRIDGDLVQEEYDDEVSGKAAKRRHNGLVQNIEKNRPEGDVRPADDILIETLQSADKMAAALESLGVDPPLKISNSTGDLTYAFAKNDLAFQALLEHENETVVALVEARLAAKSTGGETRAKRLLEMVGMPVPVCYNYCMAHTTRWSGGNKLNFQNFARQGFTDDGEMDMTTGRLRRAIMAPKGKRLVVADSAQIEARLLAWLAGQEDIMKAFAEGKDVYKRMAASIYQVPEDQITKQQRFIGKLATLGLGYSMGWQKFQHTLATGVMGPAMDVPDQECRRIVTMYRRSADKIVEMWKRSEQILDEMIQGRDGEYKCLQWSGTDSAIWLPNGLGLHYYGLTAKCDGSRFFDYSYRERGKHIHTYGGKLTENCIAEDTEVMTHMGWKKIQDVLNTDWLFDGDHWVKHGGLINKSVQRCVIVDGVYMTPDHEVLTNEGWKTALDKPRPYRPNIWGVDRYSSGWQRRQEDVLDVQLRVQQRRGKSWFGSYERNKTRRDSELRMLNTKTTICSENSRNEQTSSLCCMAKYVRSLPTTFTPIMEKLRRAWDNCMRAMAERFHGILERHERYLPAWVGFRSQEQQQRVQQTELPLDNSKTKLSKQKEQLVNKRSDSVLGDGNPSFYTLLSTETRCTERSTIDSVECEKQVYDILNCGPQQRFVVLGTEGPFIVHNCVQALARVVIGEQLLEINEKYRVVMMSHDENVAVAPAREADKALKFMIETMRITPKWAPGLVLNAEGGHDERYSK